MNAMFKKNLYISDFCFSVVLETQCLLTRTADVTLCNVIDQNIRSAMV